MKIAFFGLGEAGSLFGADLASAGVSVTGYDPAKVETPAGVARFDNPMQAVIEVDAVIAVTQGSDAIIAVTQALTEIPQEAFYADFSSNSPQTKNKLAIIAAEVGLDFVDVALMGTVPGKGLRTPALASGSGN